MEVILHICDSYDDRIYWLGKTQSPYFSAGREPQLEARKLFSFLIFVRDAIIFVQTKAKSSQYATATKVEFLFKTDWPCPDYWTGVDGSEYSF